MKKSSYLFTLLTVSALASSITLRANDALNTPTAQPAEQPAVELSLTEQNADIIDAAGNPSDPLVVPVGSKITIQLMGDQTHSGIYSSGSGSMWGHSWTFVDSLEYGPKGPALALVSSTLTLPTAAEKAPYSIRGTTLSKTYTFTFEAKHEGQITLPFNQYYYSNATIRNLDGSSPWKDPVKTIDFRITVVK